MKRIYFLMLTLFCINLGFAQTVSIVNDVLEGTNGTGPSNICSNNQFMIYAGFTENISAYEREVYLSDGINIRMVEINTGVSRGQPASCNFADELVFNKRIYFEAKDVSYAYSIYSFDTYSSEPKVFGSFEWQYPKGMGDKIVFMYKNTTTGLYYFKSWSGEEGVDPVLMSNQILDDGSETAVSDIEVKTYDYTILGDKIIFSGQNVSAGQEPCVYDPANTNGYQLLGDLNSGTASSFAKGFVSDGNNAYFMAKNSDGKYLLWKTDGSTVEELTAVSTILYNAASSVQGQVVSGTQIFIANGKVYFTGDDTANGQQLYAFDITDQSATMISSLKDANNEAVDFAPSDFIMLDGIVYFVGNYAIETGTAKAIYQINTKGELEICEVTKKLSSHDYLTAFNGKIYFSAIDDQYVNNNDGTYTSSGAELFVFTPGTSTSILKAFNKEEVKVYPNPSNGTVYVSGIKDEQASYSIYNLAGNLVEKGLINNGAINYNISAGMYMLQVSDKGESITTKIIVK